MTKLQKALPNCKIEWDGAKADSGTPKAGAAASPDRTVAEWVLGLKGSVGVRQPGSSEILTVKSGQTLPPGPFSLVEIALRSRQQNELDARPPELLALDSLETLSFEACVATNAFAADLAKLPSLTRVALVYANSLSDPGLASLAQLPRLASLDVSRCSVTKAGIDTFRKACAELPGNLGCERQLAR